MSTTHIESGSRITIIEHNKTLRGFCKRNVNKKQNMNEFIKIFADPSNKEHNLLIQGVSGRIVNIFEDYSE